MHEKPAIVEAPISNSNQKFATEKLELPPQSSSRWFTYSTAVLSLLEKGLVLGLVGDLDVRLVVLGHIVGLQLEGRKPSLLDFAGAQR